MSSKKKNLITLVSLSLVLGICIVLYVFFPSSNNTDSGTKDQEKINEVQKEKVVELENFEDKNGNGSYKASYGHDDLIMTFVQIPMVQQTSKYKSMMEEYIEATVEESYNNNAYVKEELQKRLHYV